MYFCMLPSEKTDMCTWLFDVFEPSVLLRNALHLCTVRCAFVIHNVNRKQSRGNYTILAENGLGNLKRCLICNALL